ncbi:MAG: HEAT repeat domain-containing protein [Promethearchaeota archaeon]
MSNSSKLKIKKIIEKFHNVNSDEKIKIIRNLAESREIEFISDDDAKEFAKIIASDADEKVRTEAAIFLGNLKLIQLGDIVIKLAEDDDPAVKMEAIIALGKLGSNGFMKSKSILENLLKDQNYFIRKYAIKALGFCGDNNSIDLLLPIFNERKVDLEIKELIAETIGEIGGSYAFSILKEWAQAGEMEVRREAINALGKLANENAVELLIKIYKRKDEYKVIKNYAKHALKQILEHQKMKYLNLKKKLDKIL